MDAVAFYEVLVPHADEREVRDPIVLNGRRVVEDVHTDHERTPPRFLKKRDEEDRKHGLYPLVLEGRCRTHVQHPFPHLIPAVQPAFPATGQVAFADVSEIGFHEFLLK